MNIDFTSAAWNEVARWAEENLTAARRRNDSTELDSEQTAAVRGEIRFLKKLLALPQTVARDQQTGSPQGHLAVWGDTTPEV
jgi:hypothetical protein